MWHNLGKVNVTKGSDVVTGVGTKWVENVRVGDAFQGPDGKLYQVINVASDEALAISPAYEGSTATNLNYWIVPIPGFSKTQADRLALIINRLDGDIAKAFEEFLRKDSNLADVEDKKVARDNLGITAAFDEFNSELLGINEELGTVLRKDSNLADVKDKKVARDNLGLGTAATRDVGKNVGNVLEVGAFGLGSNTADNVGEANFKDVERSVLFSHDTGRTPEDAPENGPAGGFIGATTASRFGGLWVPNVDNKNAYLMHKNGSSADVVWTRLVTSKNLRTSTGISTEFPMSQKATTDALADKANTTTQIIAGNGLTGGGSLAANRTLTLGTPSTITKTATNSVSPTSHTHELGDDVKNSLSLADGSLQKAQNLNDIPNKNAARHNLGLGSAATKDVGMSTGMLMEVGAFGLGGRTVPGTANADEIDIGSRFYTAPAGHLGISGVHWGLHINHSANGYATQMEWKLNSFHFRTAEGGVWSEPYKVTHSGNLRQETGSSTDYPMSQKAVTDAINGVSDRRDKAEIEDLEVGLSLIKNLKPKLYKLNLRSWYRDQEAAVEEVTTDPETGEEVTSVSADPDVLAKPLSEYDDNDGSLAKDKPYTGFIAQELAHTLKELGLDDLGLVKNYQDEYGGDDRYYIEHEGLLAFIVRAIQEQQEQIEKLQLKVEQLEGKG